MTAPEKYHSPFVRTRTPSPLTLGANTLSLSPPAAAPPLPPVRAPPANPRVMVDLTGWHAVPASQAAQFYTERGALVCEQPGFASQPR